MLLHREPAAAEAAVVEPDQFGDAAAEAGLHEAAELGHVLGEQVEVIEPPRGGAAGVEATGEVLQRGPVARPAAHSGACPNRSRRRGRTGSSNRKARPWPRSPSTQPMTLNPLASIAVDPPLERLGRGGAIGDVADAGGVVAGQLERVELVVVPGAQVGRGRVLGRQLQSVDAGEEVEALVVFVRVHLDMAEMGDVMTGLAHRWFLPWLRFSELVHRAREDRLKALGVF